MRDKTMWLRDNLLFEAEDPTELHTKPLLHHNLIMYLPFKSTCWGHFGLATNCIKEITVLVLVFLQQKYIPWEVEHKYTNYEVI